MSVEQLKSIRQAKLRRKALAYGKRVTSKRAPPLAISFVADGWLDGYMAALDDVRKVAAKASDGPEHSSAKVGYDVALWLEEMPK